MENEKRPGRPVRAWKQRGIFALVSSRLPDTWESGAAEEAEEELSDPEQNQS